MQFAGVDFEEVEFEDSTDAEKRAGVDCPAVENLVNVGPAAIKTVGEPRHGQSFLRDFLVYQFTNIDHKNACIPAVS